MPSWKKGKKSRSVNDIPVEKKPDQLIQSLDDADFRDLLNNCARPTYSRTSSGFLGFQGVRGDSLEERETSAVVKVCEKGLRDEDAAKEKIRKEQRAGKRGSKESSPPAPNWSRSPSPPIQYYPSAPAAPFSNKAVNLDSKDIDFIDAGDVEMTDLSGIPPPSPRRFFRGNHEETVQEYGQNDVEMGLMGGGSSSGFRGSSVGGMGVRDGAMYDYINTNSHKWPTDPKEDFLSERSGGVLNRHQTIMPPQNEGMFSSFSDDLIGTDEIPLLNPSHMPLPQTAQLVRLDSGNGNLKVEEKAQETVNTTKLDGKKKKKKKDKEAKNTLLAKDIPGYMGELPLEKLVKIIEGDAKKQKNDSTSVAAEDSGKKDRRRKSKEVAQMGNQNAKITSDHVKVTAEHVKVTPTNSIKNSDSGLTIVSPTQQSKSSPTTKKGGKKADARKASAAILTEDAEEEFLSADEGVASSTSDDAFVASDPVSVTIPSSEVMLDGANYRADDEDVTMIERQITEEQEFITVAGKTKKKPFSHAQNTRTGSAGKMLDRRQHLYEGASSDGTTPRRSSMEGGMGMTSSVGSATKAPPLSAGIRRPPTTSLADFIDDRKTEVRKHSGGKQSTNSHGKSLRQERVQSTADSELAYHDAQSDELMMTSTMRLNGTCTPDRSVGFSYADVAKKSSEQSRENSPANSQQNPCVGSVPATPSPTPAESQQLPEKEEELEKVSPPMKEELEKVPTKQEEPEQVPKENEQETASSSSSSGAVAELPNDVISGAAESTGGLSFFYDENAETQMAKDNNNVEATIVEEDAFVLNLGDGKTFRFAKGMAASTATEPTDARHQMMIEAMAQRWNEFQKGAAPIYYQPKAAV